MGQGNTKSGVIGWGSNEHGQLGSSANKRSQLRILEHLRTVNVVAISAKATYAGALTDTGELWMWGRGEAGQLGFGLGESVSPIPRPIRSLQGKIVKQISFGDHHCALVTDAGTLFTWGRGQNGRLGHATTESEHAPRLVEALVGIHVLAVACGDFHTIVATSSSRVWTFGLGLSGRLGLGDEEDRLVPEMVVSNHWTNKEILAVAAGGHHSAVLVAPGVLYTFGGGSFGKLGHGDLQSCLKPKLLTSLSHVRLCGIALGSHFSAALSLNGEVYVWGQGQGSGCEDVLLPEKPAEFASFTTASIACGKNFVCAVTHSGDMYVRGPPSPELLAATTGFGSVTAGGETNKPQAFCLLGKGIVQLAVGDKFCVAMADASRAASIDATEAIPIEQEAPAPAIVSSRKSLVHVLENVIRIAPPPPSKPSNEGEVIFLSGELQRAQIENQNLTRKLQETLSRIAHLERENVSLREELDASLQCLPVGGVSVTTPIHSEAVPPTTQN